MSPGLTAAWPLSFHRVLNGTVAATLTRLEVGEFDAPKASLESCARTYADHGHSAIRAPSQK